MSLVCVCGFGAAMDSNGMVYVMPPGVPRYSTFDDDYPAMMRASRAPHSYRVFYAQQVAALQAKIAGAKLILDVGCGPTLQYARPVGSVILGLDSSYESLRHNPDVDIRLWGSAISLPLPDKSVDAIICLYSLHHLVGRTVEETKDLVALAFAEFRRVLRPGGTLLVFEVVPWWPAWALQRLAWMLSPLNTFFWRRRALEKVVSEYLPGAWYEYRAITVSPFLVFPFAFTLPWLRLPRFLYPFQIAMCSWRMP